MIQVWGQEINVWGSGQSNHQRPKFTFSPMMHKQRSKEWLPICYLADITGKTPFFG
jgi:hypothetical protein